MRQQLGVHPFLCLHLPHPSLYFLFKVSGMTGFSFPTALGFVGFLEAAFTLALLPLVAFLPLVTFLPLDTFFAQLLGFGVGLPFLALLLLGFWLLLSSFALGFFFSSARSSKDCSKRFMQFSKEFFVSGSTTGASTQTKIIKKNKLKKKRKIKHEKNKTKKLQELCP